MSHPFRFGIQASSVPDASSWFELARKTEQLGYSSLHLPDHFGDQLAPVPAIMAAASATEQLKVGALVFDNDYRHPVVLAKELATIDLLSEGRLEFGLGAGWMTSDYEQSGIQHDRAGIRVDRMIEAISVFRGCFGGEPFSYEGEHYKIEDLTGTPMPYTEGGPPLLVGGGGKRVLGVAAREAAIVGVNPSMHEGEIGLGAIADASAEATDRKLGWVKEAAGDRFDDIELNCLVIAAMVTDDRLRTANDMLSRNPSEELMLQSVLLDLPVF